MFDIITFEYTECKRHRRQEPCWNCQREQAVCKTKIRFATREEADEWVAEYNESHGYINPVLRYKCRWCAYWHMTKAKLRGSHRQGSVIKRMKRKWLISKELERRSQHVSQETER